MAEKKIYKTALYLRISREADGSAQPDEGEKESGSIANQRDLLRAFARTSCDLEIVSEYVDDGYSGFTFDRPEFKKMISAAKSGKTEDSAQPIDCILVKDLSRFGRNFIKTEEYIQLILPKLGVRFIAVADGIDTAREKTASEMVSIPVKNLLNEFHVAETSQKVRKAYEVLSQKGEFIGAQTVFGYTVKDKKLEIDPEAAEAVKKIFGLKIGGYSCQGIADCLNEESVLCPMEHKLSKGGASSGKHFKTGEKALWSQKSVRRILENPVYTGTLIQGKTTTPDYKNKQRYTKDPSEWAISEDAHEAIISETVFQIAADLMGRDSYSLKNNESYLFSRFAFCGNCGEPLYHRKERERVYYHCRNKNCQNKRNIRGDTLESAVFEMLKAHLKLVLNSSRALNADEVVVTDTIIKDLKAQIQNAENMREKLLSQTKNGVITAQEMEELSAFYNAKIAKTEYEIEVILNKKRKIAQEIDEVVRRYAQYRDMIALTREIVVTFTEKIIVEDKNSVNICFRYADFFTGTEDKNGA